MIDTPEVFSTDTFSINPNDCLKIETLRWLTRYWSIIAIPIALLFAYGIYDLRFLLLALILLLVIAPQVLLLVYFSRMLSPSVPSVLASKHLKITKNKHIKVIYDKTDPTKSASFCDYTLPWDEITTTSKVINHIIIESKRLDKKLIIPIESIPSPNYSSIFFNDTPIDTWLDN